MLTNIDASEGHTDQLVHKLFIGASSGCMQASGLLCGLCAFQKATMQGKNGTAAKNTIYMQKEQVR